MKNDPVSRARAIGKYTILAVFLLALIYGAFRAAQWGQANNALRYVHLTGAFVGVLLACWIGVLVINDSVAAKEKDSVKAYSARVKLVAEIFAGTTLVTLIAAMYGNGLQIDQRHRVDIAEQAKALFEPILKSTFCDGKKMTALCNLMEDDLELFLKSARNNASGMDVEVARKSALNLATTLKLKEIRDLLQKVEIDPLFGDLYSALPILVFGFASQSVSRKVALAIFERYEIKRPLTILRASAMVTKYFGNAFIRLKSKLTKRSFSMLRKNTLALILIILLSFSTGCAVGLINMHPPSAYGDLATWVGAIGTVMAFIGTIVISLSQGNDMRQQSYARAMLASAGIVPKLQSFLSITAEVERELLNVIEDDDNPTYITYASRLEKACTWTVDETVPLVSLPDNAAYLLEHARSKVASCVQILTEASSHGHQDTSANVVKFDVDEVRKVKAEVARTLSQARNAVQSSIETCAKTLPSSES